MKFPNFYKYLLIAVYCLLFTVFSFSFVKGAQAQNNTEYCSGTTPETFSCPSGYRKNVYGSNPNQYICLCVNEDREQCKSQGGEWNADLGMCLDKTTVACNNGICPDGYQKFDTATFGCRCSLIKFKGKALIIRPEECDAASLGYDHSEGATSYQKGIQTALGCIPTDPTGLVAWIFKFAIYIGGGIAFLLMCWGVFLIITSAGNPEQLKAGQEIMVSAGGGLIFIAFAVFMLRLIGADILKIPGFQ